MGGEHDPKSPDQWIEKAEDFKGAAEKLFDTGTSPGVIKHLAQRSAECFLKAVLCRRDPSYDGKKHRHNMQALLRDICQISQDFSKLKGPIDEIETFLYGADNAEVTSCLTSCEVYNPDAAMSSSDSQTTSEALHTIAVEVKSFLTASRDTFIVTEFEEDSQEE